MTRDAAAVVETAQMESALYWPKVHSDYLSTTITIHVYDGYNRGKLKTTKLLDDALNLF